jgi:Fe-S oxidoreductase/nitrate reductase gamma subunit
LETREIYWNIQGYWIMYALFVVSLGVFAFGSYQHIRLIAIGKREGKPDNHWERLKRLLLHGLLQLRSLRELYSGTMHMMFFWGFIVLALGTVVVFLEADFGIPIMRGAFYLYFQSLILDIFGLLAIVGILMAIFKRYLLRPDRLVNPSRFRNLLGDGFVLGLILIILVTGFFLEGARIVATDDQWADWSPVGYATGVLLQAIFPNVEAIKEFHRYTWWFHMGIAFAFIAYIPYSKLRHIIFSPLNIYFGSLDAAGVLKPIDIETAETLGTAKFRDFMWKRILEAEACTECGRCQAACPVYNSSQPLSPKGVILDLRNKLYSSKEKLLADKGAERETDATANSSQSENGTSAIEAVTPEALWSCLTCGSCMEQCPVFIEHVPTILDMRRYLVMEQADFPELMQDAITCLEQRGHPHRGTRFSRTDWCEGMGVKIVGDSGPAEWLYWVGCTAAFDERNQKVAKAFATVLQRAGVDFAILGEEENCTGDVARRIGNEYLFQTLAQGNIATLQRYGIRKIVTTCPHCYNSLKTEYSQFGGDFEVYHHSELLCKLVKEGKLSLGRTGIGTLTFHDSCYLARYNEIIQAPREVLNGLPDANMIEIVNSGKRTFCCGGGGGHLWFEEYEGKRVNHSRAKQLLTTNAPVASTACPFCMIMLTDGINTVKGDREMQLLDIAELVEIATRPAKPI